MFEPTLRVKIKNLELKTPLVLCSGTAGPELKDFLDFKDVGALITKTITLNEREGNPPPRIAESACGVINSIGLENPGLKGFLASWEELKRLPTQIIVSIYAEKKEEFKAIFRELNRINQIKAVEANLSCPNLKKEIISQSPKKTYSLVKYLRGLTPKVLIAKLTPEVSDILKIAEASLKGGADALSLTNTFFALKIDVKKRAPFLGNTFGGLSGPAIKPLVLYRVYKVYQELKPAIIASGGILNYQDALEFILAGATCVGLGTANLVNPSASHQIIKGLLNYMRRNKISTLRKIRGYACKQKQV